MSNTSNATLILSWGAPFSLDVTDSPDIFYYILCTNITIYGCRTIPSDPDCLFPRKCTLVIDITNSSLIGADERQTKVNVSYGDHIQFTFFAVNGAGNGDVANFLFLNILPGKSGLSLNQTAAPTLFYNSTMSDNGNGTPGQLLWISLNPQRNRYPETDCNGAPSLSIKTDIHVNFTETFSDGIRVFMNDYCSGNECVDADPFLSSEASSSAYDDSHTDDVELQFLKSVNCGEPDTQVLTYYQIFMMGKFGKNSTL
eukprot:Em0001g3012a